MKNVIYNELLISDYQVGVGIVEIFEKDENGKYVRKQFEVDFVANKGEERCHIQFNYQKYAKENYTIYLLGYALCLLWQA